MHREGESGIVYESVRRSGGTNVCIYRPSLVTLPVNQADHYEYRWDARGSVNVLKHDAAQYGARRRWPAVNARAQMPAPAAPRAAAPAMPQGGGGAPHINAAPRGGGGPGGGGGHGQDKRQ
jgi:hypothetical protein